LVPARAARGGSVEADVLRTLLGLGDADRPGAWPSQTDAAVGHEVTRARAGQILGKARERWIRNPSLTELRAGMVELIRPEGGVMAATELIRAVLAIRGSALEEPRRSQLASGVTRAAVETERHRGAPRWTVRRASQVVLIALDEVAD